MVNKIAFTPLIIIFDYQSINYTYNLIKYVLKHIFVNSPINPHLYQTDT